MPCYYLYQLTHFVCEEIKSRVFLMTDQMLHDVAFGSSFTILLIKSQVKSHLVTFSSLLGRLRGLSSLQFICITVLAFIPSFPNCLHIHFLIIL